MKNFQEAYIKSKTWADLENATHNLLTQEQRLELMKSMTIVKEATGLDMRQNFFLGVLRGLCGR